MQEIEKTKEIDYSNEETQLMPTSVPGTPETRTTRREKRMLAASAATPILVSEEQFRTVREEHLTSMNLLNSSGDALLRALDQMIPPEGSSRVVGEYTAQGIRQISKSMCDLVLTKNTVIRSMYQIARDEI